jgi:hypothetical protein
LALIFLYIFLNFISIGQIFDDRGESKESMRKIKLPGPKFKITSGIYLITCLATKDTYIGKSKNLNQRWCQHRHDLRNKCHNNPSLQALYDLYGQKEFTMELVELVEDHELLEAREVYWTDIKKPTLNVVNTRLSPSTALDVKNMIDSGAYDEDIISKYNLTPKYLQELKRGDKWKDIFKNNC